MGLVGQPRVGVGVLGPANAAVGLVACALGFTTNNKNKKTKRVTQLKVLQMKF